MKTILKIVALWLSLVAGGAARAQDAPSDRDVHRLIGLLDYIAADYSGAVANGHVVLETEYEEQRLFAEDASALARDLAASRDGAFLDAVLSLQRIVDDKGNATDVERASALAKRRLLEVYPVALAPGAPPSLDRGRALYTKNCAVCHGARGDADTPLAKTFDPSPLSFLGEKAQRSLTPYHAFNVVTFGVAGTPMPAYDLLSERDRWDLAAYTVSLRGEAPAPPAPSRGRLDAARATLRGAMESYRRGDAREAGRLAVEAYFEIEPLEPLLRERDGAVVARIETSYLALRRAARDGAPIADVERLRGELDREIASADRLLAATGSPSVAFAAAAVIVLREGIEAALLIAAMLALLAKLGRGDAARLVHVGWIAALAAGALTWWVGTTIVEISGAQRELVEGVVGLLAAAVLVYTSYWILSRVQARRWMELMRERLTRSLGGGGRLTLVGLAFLAVYREAFETVLFLQALLADRGAAAKSSIGLGVAGGVAALVVAIFAIFRLAKRIPMKAFFTVSGALLYALAFAFAGSGIHALIEGGYFEPRPIDSLRFLRVEWLGVYPDVASLSLQAALLAAVAIGLVVEFRTRRALAATR